MISQYHKRVDLVSQLKTLEGSAEVVFVEAELHIASFLVDAESYDIALFRSSIGEVRSHIVP